MKRSRNHSLFFSEKRVWILGGVFCGLFLLLIGRFFILQVEEHDLHVLALKEDVERSISVPAIRGEIFDRYGRALATNEPTYLLIFDQGVSLEDDVLNAEILEVIGSLEVNGDAYFDEVPISKNTPFVYVESEEKVRAFIDSLYWMDEATKKKFNHYSATYLFDILKKQFKIADTYTLDEARKIIAIRYKLSQYAYRQYEKVELTTSLSEASISFINEQAQSLHGFEVRQVARRYYPSGIYTSNVVGYTKAVSSSQYKALQEQDYKSTDVIGEMGIEATMETSLRGENGLVRLEIDRMGKSVRVIEDREPIKGKDVHLTLDLRLQEAVYKTVENHLTEAIMTRLKDEKEGMTPLIGYEVLCSLVKNGKLPVKTIENAEIHSYQYALYELLYDQYEEIDPYFMRLVSLEELLQKGLEMKDSLMTRLVILALDEKGVLKLTVQEKDTLEQGNEIDLEELLYRALSEGYIKAGDIDIDPFSGAVVAVDVESGDVLSLVSYPTYNNNEMITNFSDYWAQMSQGGRSLFWDRALKTSKAPGSIFKMVTALVGLSEDVITEDTAIEDMGIYEEVGAPYPRCWIYEHIGKGHGELNLERALEVSCNYYFYETMHLMTQKLGVEGGMKALTQMAHQLGLDRKTGIELDEGEPFVSNPYYVSSYNLNKALTLFAQSPSNDQQIETIKDSLMKGVFITSNELVEVYSSEEREVRQIPIANRQIEKLVQDHLRNEYDILLEQILIALKDYLNNHQAKLIDESLGEMSLEKDVSIEEQVIASFKKRLTPIIDKVLYKPLEALIMEMPSNQLLDIYEESYKVLYRRALRKGESRIMSILKDEMKGINYKDQLYKNNILLKVRQNMINVIVNNLLYGVELKWTEGISVRTAIGQGYNAFSPVHLARYIASLANGEYCLDLSIIKDDSDKVSKNKQSLGINKEDLESIYNGMKAVTSGDEGTATGAFEMLPIEVAAKTGTAEEGTHEHSFFVAFAPYEEPEIAIVVAVYNADGLGSTASLIAQDLVEDYWVLGQDGEGISLENIWIE